VVEGYTDKAASAFRPAWDKRWPKDEDLEYAFDLGEAKKLLAKKTEEEEAPPGT
jgi:hypothetical protein